MYAGRHALKGQQIYHMGWGAATAAKAQDICRPTVLLKGTGYILWAAGVGRHAAKAQDICQRKPRSEGYWLYHLDRCLSEHAAKA